jgi:hypothetical protein
MTVTRMRDFPGSMDVFARALERRGSIVPPREGRGVGGTEADEDEDATAVGNASSKMGPASPSITLAAAAPESSFDSSLKFRATTPSPPSVIGQSGQSL